MLDRQTLVRGALAVLAVSAVSLLFVASYAGALHQPRAHGIPIAVTAQVPGAARLDATEAFTVTRVADEAAAQQRIDERKAYGAVLATPSGVEELAGAAAPRPAAGRGGAAGARARRAPAARGRRARAGGVLPRRRLGRRRLPRRDAVRPGLRHDPGAPPRRAAPRRSRRAGSRSRAGRRAHRLGHRRLRPGPARHDARRGADR